MAKAGPRRYEICPHCGADYPSGRLACPECGSDAQTGWKSAEEISYESVEIPDTYDPEVWEKKGEVSTPRWMVITAYVIITSFLISIGFFGITALIEALRS